MKIPAWIRTNPVLPWAALFLAVNLFVTQYGAVNALSRFAELRAITERHTLRIDAYGDWTIDWARAPDGHLYSNKAPGPVLLGLPMFALTDLFVLPFAPKDSLQRAPEPTYWQHLLLMLWLQLIPAMGLVLYASRRLLERGADPAAVHFFALAALFGNTAAAYMNSNFGHGVASLLFLGAALAWWDQRYAWTGLLLGASLLSDYGVAFALPFFILATAWRERRWRALVEIGVGATPPALVWIWYHVTCFGSPFRTANQFTNPTQIETLPGRANLWGEYSPFPSPSVVGDLLFGSSRGLLVTQPWMFGVLALPFLRRRERGLALLAVGSLGGLLWMNGGFGGWHGGWCIGPRYLSVVFLAMAFALAASWGSTPRWLRTLMWAGLAVALGFRFISYPFSNLAPVTPLWPYFTDNLLNPEHRGTKVLRLALAVLSSSAAAFWVYRRRRIPFLRNPV